MRHILIATVAVLAIASIEAHAGQSKEELVGYWRLDEGTGRAVKDASGNKRDGRILNAGRGTRWVEGRSGRAVEFLGGDPSKRSVAGCIEIPNVGDMDFTGGLTIELWIKFTRIDRPETYELVSNTESDRGKGFRLTLSWLQLAIRSGPGDPGNNWGAASNPAKTPIRTGVWYHLAATYDGATYRVYLDGVQVATSEPGLSLTKGRPSIYIGAFNGGYAYGLNGVVDDIRIHNHALSPRQILNAAKFSF